MGSDDEWAVYSDEPHSSRLKKTQICIRFLEFKVEKQTNIIIQSCSLNKVCESSRQSRRLARINFPSLGYRRNSASHGEAAAV